MTEEQKDSWIRWRLCWATCIMLLITAFVPHVVISLQNIHDTTMTTREWSDKMDGLYWAYIKSSWWVYSGIWGWCVIFIFIYSLQIETMESKSVGWAPESSPELLAQKKMAEATQTDRNPHSEEMTEAFAALGNREASQALAQGMPTKGPGSAEVTGQATGWRKTIGERMVRISFNASGSSAVDRLKTAGAHFIDMIDDFQPATGWDYETAKEFQDLKRRAIECIADGTMQAVKMVTTSM